MMNQLLPIAKRVSGPYLIGNIIWMAFGATLLRAGCICWEKKDCISAPIGDLRGPSRPKHIREIAIADADLLTAAVLIVRRG